MATAKRRQQQAMSKPQTTSEGLSYSRICAPRRSCRPAPKLPTSGCASPRTRIFHSVSFVGDPRLSPFIPPTRALSAAIKCHLQRGAGAEVLGISVDGAWCHKAFAEHRSIHFPLLSDFEPKGEVAKSYGANRYTQRVCERPLFVIEKDGVFFWSYLSRIAMNPGADGILDALEGLQQKERVSAG